MNKDQILKVFFVLGFSFFLLLISFILSNQNSDNINEIRFDLAETIEISIKPKEGDVFSLKLNNNFWEIDGEIANQSEVENILDVLKKTTVSRVASENKDNYYAFEITDKSPYLEITTNQDKFKIFVGKISGVNSSYIKLENSEKIFEVNQNFQTIVGKKSEVFKTNDKEKQSIQ